MQGRDVLKSRRRIEDAIVIFALRWRRMGVVDGEPGTGFCPVLPVALLAPCDRGAAGKDVCHSSGSAEPSALTVENASFVTAAICRQ
jgi:hypothetical protein